MRTDLREGAAKEVVIVIQCFADYGTTTSEMGEFLIKIFARAA